MDSAIAGVGGVLIRPLDHVILNVGATFHDGGATATGTVLSTGLDVAQIDIGFREHWFSPFTNSAMIVSTEAEPRPSITVSNYAPISRLGFRYAVYRAHRRACGIVDRIERSSIESSGDERQSIDGWAPRL